MRVAALCRLALFWLVLGGAAQAQTTPEGPSGPTAPPQPGAAVQPEEPALTDPAFAAWLTGFRLRALDSGLSEATLDALATVTFLPDVVERDRNQNEFSKAIWDYLDTAVSADRVSAGQAALTQHADLFAAIEARHGVEAEVVAAIWGLESAYGLVRGDVPTLSALATLAFDGRRGAFFEGQLLAALTILQSGDTTADQLRGSWAGAMGHTQFMPGSYLERAVDFTGDGRRDIWGDDPADALASTAAYLAGFGWTLGQPWGVEVTVPEGFDYTLARIGYRQTATAWGSLGVLGLDGQPVAQPGTTQLLLPAGARGPAFLIWPNFNVIERYNTADAYVIAVGHLSDRLRGGGPVRAAWPRDDRALTFAERQELQERLTAAGFDTRGIDGLIGPRTIGAIRAYQQAAGLLPDGYGSLRLLEGLRGQ